MKKYQFVGGIGFIIAGMIFLFAETAVPIPIPIALMVVGIALIAASRKKTHRWQS